MRRLTLFLGLFFFAPLNGFAETGPCQNGEDVTFEWEWCGPSKSSGSSITDVCFGNLTYTDIVYSAVQLESRSATGSSFECLYASGTWDDFPIEGCPRGIKRFYGAAYGEYKETAVFECHGENGIFRIFGNSLDGRPFDAERGSPPSF
ncbi:MAG: hypothetical protein AB7T49_15600 [Oligoflexales bacterium]